MPHKTAYNADHGLPFRLKFVMSKGHYHRYFYSVKTMSQHLRRISTFDGRVLQEMLHAGKYEPFAVFGNQIVPLSVLALKVQELQCRCK